MNSLKGKSFLKLLDLTPEQMRMYRWAAIKAGLFVALVFGIVLVFELPQSLFRPFGPSGQRRKKR